MNQPSVDQPSASNKKVWYQINPPVFFGSTLFIALFLAITLLAPQFFDTLTTQVKNWISTFAGWFYILAVAGFLIFIVCIALSSFGKLKLGPDHSKPDYGYGHGMPCYLQQVWALG